MDSLRNEMQTAEKQQNDEDKAFHILNANFTRPLKFTNPFSYEPHPLCIAATEKIKDYIYRHNDLLDELSHGKMLGVLVVENKEKETGFLAAFSGTLLGTNILPFFVPPVYDILQPGETFKQGENQLNEINLSIKELEGSTLLKSVTERLSIFQEEANKEILSAREKMKISKLRRDQLREDSKLTNEENDELIRESQWEKAEFVRLKRRLKAEEDELKERKSVLTSKILELKNKRKSLSDELQRWIFDRFSMLNSRKEHKTLTDIFTDYSNSLPPAGSGECCAPKLLQYAYSKGYKPLCMAEFWWGESPKGEIRHHLCYYPACHSKCKPILGYMLQGIDMDSSYLNRTDSLKDKVKIIYSDNDIIVADKPSGMPSVDGKIETDSLEAVVREMFDINTDTPIVVHRLDMATSGIVVFARNKNAHENIQKQFRDHKVKKIYVADTEGCPSINEGIIRLPLRPDINDRPRQMVDMEHGKYAETKYMVMGTHKEGKTTICRLHLFPSTGRTHQIRVHCAHKDGLDCPIIGDTLYGNTFFPGERLHLHAAQITFFHPSTNQTITFSSQPDF